MMFKAFMVAALLVTQSAASKGHGAANKELPKGWEARTDPRTGRTYYIDLINKTTTWDHPKPAQKPSKKPAKPIQDLDFRIKDDQKREEPDEKYNFGEEPDEKLNEDSSQDSNDGFTASEFVDQFTNDLPEDSLLYFYKAPKRTALMANALMQIPGKLHFDYMTSDYKELKSLDNSLLLLRELNERMADKDTEYIKQYSYTYPEAAQGMLNMFISTYLATLPSKGENIRKFLKTQEAIPRSVHGAAIFALKRLIDTRDNKLDAFAEPPSTKKGKVQFDDEYKSALNDFIGEKNRKKRNGKGNMREDLKIFFEGFIQAVIADGIGLDEGNFNKKWAKKSVKSSMVKKSK